MNTKNILILLSGIIIFIGGIKMKVTGFQIMVPLSGILLIIIATVLALKTLKK